MNEQPGIELALPVGRLQGRAHRLRIDRLGHRPAHDAAACQIHHRGQIRPAPARGDIGYVGHSRPTRLPVVETPMQDVASRRQPMHGIRGHHICAQIDRANGERTNIVLSPFTGSYADCACLVCSMRSGRILNQMAYIAGKNTRVMTVPPSVPPISV